VEGGPRYDSIDAQTGLVCSGGPGRRSASPPFMFTAWKKPTITRGSFSRSRGMVLSPVYSVVTFKRRWTRQLAMDFVR
jgi:hypothetical protein